MLTRCPSCQTLFRVYAPQLRAAGGLVRCGKCDHLFNALDHLSEQLPGFPAAATGDPEPRIEIGTPPPGRAERGVDDAPDLSQESAIAESAAPADPATPEQSMPASDDDQTQPASADQPDDDQTSTGASPALESVTTDDGVLVAQHRTTLETESPEAIDDATDHPAEAAEAIAHAASGLPAGIDQLPFEVPEDLPEIEPSALTDDAAEGPPATRRRPLATALWLLLSLALASAIPVQWAWWQRHELLLSPRGRSFLQHLCRYAGCQLPLPRAPAQIEILERRILPHPRTDGALLVELIMVNRAPFAQAYPELQLSLFNDQKILARRRFAPSEYLPFGYQEGASMAPRQPLRVRLEVVDPGSGTSDPDQQATGFEFEFF